MLRALLNTQAVMFDNADVFDCLQNDLKIHSS